MPMHEFGFETAFLRATLMGPNCLRILDELLTLLPLQRGIRILDLGCGMGLTSIYLARELQAQVFAADLWVDPSDNLSRFCAFGLEDRIIPLKAEAHELPFAKGYFDAVLSVDAYHYFGAVPGYMENHVLPLLKPGGILAVAVPGLQQDFADGVPEALQPFWQEDMHFHSPGWWKTLWSQIPGVEVFACTDLSCHKQAWEDWLACDNPYAVGDRSMMAAEGGTYFSTVALAARKI